MTPSRIRDPLHLRVWFSRAPHTPEPGYARRRDRLVGTTVRRGGNRAKSWRRGDGPGLIGKSFSVKGLWRRREGVEPSGDLAIPRLVLKTSGTTGHHPSPSINPGSLLRTQRAPLRGVPSPTPLRAFSCRGPTPASAASVAQRLRALHPGRYYSGLRVPSGRPETSRRAGTLPRTRTQPAALRGALHPLGSVRLPNSSIYCRDSAHEI